MASTESIHKTEPQDYSMPLVVTAHCFSGIEEMVLGVLRGGFS